MRSDGAAIARSCIVAALLACAACHPPTRPAPRPAGSWEERKAQLLAADRWRFDGRVAISGVESGGSAGIRWQQSRGRSDVAVFGALGAGGLDIAVDGEHLRVKTSRGEVVEDEAARRVIEERLGVPLPLAELRYWLVGIAAPGSDANEVLGDNQRLTTLSQQGWDVQFTEYQAVGGDLLPARLDASHEGVRVRLRISRWQWP
ncbi:MAG TPA: lipoprotein insertase outer membrane protein LolB [Steroidobacteraceae bacterium]|nr:lipoprotein insertase outer membrane protein LolB [Steroidobacteraceae bacterium]